LSRNVATAGAGIVHVAAVFAAPLVQSGALVPLLERHWPRIDIFAVHGGPNPPIARVHAFIDAAKSATKVALAESRPRWRSA
jgi:hypothetical protein